MDYDSTLDSGLSLRPLAVGLREVVSGWSGEGSIFDELASFTPADALEWTAGDIRRRAQRVLLGLIRDDMDMLPSTVRLWQEYLPQTTVPRRATTRHVAGRVDWARTVRQQGWPPRQFVTRERSRVVDEVTIRTLAWIGAELRPIVESSGPLAPLTASATVAALEVIEATLSLYPEALPERPDRLDLGSLAGSGHPWTAVSRIASIISRSAADPEFIAFELIAPEPELAWRLFHLAVYGNVIRTLREHRFLVVWRRPLSGTAPGAQIEAVSPTGKSYDLWFEGGAARRHYNLPPAPYATVVKPIPHAGGPIGVDIALVQPGARALLMECKWSNAPGYVGRYGYHQAASYALEARAGLATDVWSFVVGPDELVTANSASDVLRATTGVVLGATSPLRLPQVIAGWLADDISTVQVS